MGATIDIEFDENVKAFGIVDKKKIEDFIRKNKSLSENEAKLKDMILSIKQQKADIRSQKSEIKEQERTLKELEDDFMSLALQEYGGA